MGVQLAVLCAIFVLVMNSTLLLYGLIATRPFAGAKGGVGTLYEGDCKAAARLSTFLHLFINVLSR